MLTRKLTSLWGKTLTKQKFHTSSKICKEYENPILRTLRILKQDLTLLRPNAFTEKERYNAEMGLVPRHADVVIIGGGPIGSSAAYWLKEKTGQEGISVVVIEKDLKFINSTTRMCAGALHQQYSLPENIEMALYGADFIRNIKKKFGEDTTDLRFTPLGYLVLANEEGAQQLMDNCAVQKEVGAHTEILSRDQLAKRFSWLDLSNIELGCYSLDCSGWFDPWALVTQIRSKTQDMGVQYIEGEVVDFVFKEHPEYVSDVLDSVYKGTNELVLKLSNGEHRNLEFAYCIMAAGTGISELAQFARIGSGTGVLSIPLPIHSRKRLVYRFDCADNPPGINSPVVVDHTSLYFRRYNLGGSFLTGIAPLEEPDDDKVEAFFHEKIAPVLRDRVPAFNSIQLKDCWSGTYDSNYFDDCGIIGCHPYYHNLFLATGFSEQGTQLAPAVGRALAEMIIDGKFRTLDLSRLSFDRLVVDQPIYELISRT